ncbi:4690_t:CDS:2, partial [Dentiscutata heterogama]
MPQAYNHRLTKYIHVQNDLSPAQKAKRAICKACESKEIYFKEKKMKCLYWREFWIEEDQEIMTYPDPDETIARNAVITLRQARTQNNTLSISIASSGSNTYFVVRQLLPTEQNEFHRRLLQYAEKSESAQVSTLLETQEPKNVRRQEILEAVILSATNRLNVWGAKDISSTSQKTTNVLNTIRTFLKRAKKQNLNVVAMVTDSASSYASARSKWALQSYSILYLNSNKLSSKARTAINSHDAANLFDVTYSFTYIAQQYENETDGFGYAMLQKLEKHWANWEQPLLFLALAGLNIITKCGIFTDERFNNTLEAISEEHNVQSKVSNSVVGLALMRYWEFAALNLKEIGKIALRLYGIKVNSAPCVRLFSRMRWLTLNDVAL